MDRPNRAGMGPSSTAPRTGPGRGGAVSSETVALRPARDAGVTPDAGGAHLHEDPWQTMVLVRVLAGPARGRSPGSPAGDGGSGKKESGRPEPEKEAREKRAPTGRGAVTGTETILLVDDEPGIRDLYSQALAALGYTVLTAASAPEALQLAGEWEQGIDLLLTDVVMPGTGGRELAEALAAVRPGLCIVYMSGYTDDAVLREGVAAASVNFIQKPIRPSHLAARLREILDSR